MKTVAVLFAFLAIHLLWGQKQILTPGGSVDRSRVIGVSAGLVGGSALGMTGLWHLWYKESESGQWKFIDDSHFWLQMDKAGHFYTAYQLNKTATSLYRWTGLDNKRSTIIGAGYSVAFQTTLELFDGFSTDWGFSWSDIGANTLGTASFTAQSLLWGEQRVLPKFSSFPSEYAALRPEVLGENPIQQILKDYNGQTYWLSFSPGTFMKNSSFPKWLCFSVGYSADAKIIGDSETYYDPNTDRVYDASREFIFSLDVDFSQLNIQKPWLRTIVNQLNYLKIPFPVLILSNGQISGSPLYF